jgi:hypothetical protein
VTGGLGFPPPHAALEAGVELVEVLDRHRFAYRLSSPVGRAP